MNKQESAEIVAANIRKDMYISNANAYKLIELADMQRDLEYISDADFGYFEYEGALISLAVEAANKLGVDIDSREEFLQIAREAYKAAGMDRSDDEIMSDYYDKKNLEKCTEGLSYYDGEIEWIYHTKTKQIEI